jgi:hypothetical protein
MNVADEWRVGGYMTEVSTGIVYHRWIELELP